MKLMLIIALILNLVILGCELYALGHIKDKLNILKYYTYLQNFLSLITSLICSVYLIISIPTDETIPEFVKGLRYVATCGLVATMFIFIVFLGNGKRIAMTEDDFLSEFSPKKANIIFHYICPMISLLNFMVFERHINLTNDIWTGIVAIPSCTYWITYIVLSKTKLWEEPYDFTATSNKNNLLEILTMLLIPLSFIAISFILWSTSSWN